MARHVGKLYFGCEQCHQAVARHRVDGVRYCCKCYIRAGFDPADWHPDCVAEFKRKQEQASAQCP